MLSFGSSPSKKGCFEHVVEKNHLLLNFGGRNNNKIHVSFINCFIMTHQNNYLKRLTMLVAYHFLKVEQLTVILQFK